MKIAKSLRAEVTSTQHPMCITQLDVDAEIFTYGHVHILFIRTLQLTQVERKVLKDTVQARNHLRITWLGSY